MKEVTTPSELASAQRVPQAEAEAADIHRHLIGLAFAVRIGS